MAEKTAGKLNTVFRLFAAEMLPCVEDHGKNLKSSRLIIGAFATNLNLFTVIYRSILSHAFCCSQRHLLRLSKGFSMTWGVLKTRELLHICWPRIGLLLSRAGNFVNVVDMLFPN